LDLPTAFRINTFVLGITAGDANSVLLHILNDEFSSTYLEPNTDYTIVLTAEDDATGTLMDSTYLYFTTPPCPDIFVETGLANADRCVNGDGATKTYTFTTRDGDYYPTLDAGILEGATWTIDWGDGSGPSVFFTSTYTNDGPGPFIPVLPGFESGALQHTYFEHEDCYYTATLLIENPGVCASIGAQSENRIPILHGRDLDADGNGQFIVDEVGTLIRDTIYVCAGNEYTTNIEDISTWDCQPPLDPVAEENEPDRTLQWVYGGAAPDGSTEANANTITGNVVIGGLGSVTSGGPGIVGDTVVTPDPILNISAPITIPATAQEGEMFKIYYKNWNKCNPFTGTEFNNSNFIQTEIVIKIIHAPDAPPADDEVYCEDAVGPLTASTTEGGTLTWYSEPEKINVLGTGATFNHGETDPGTYPFYVAETVPPCEGPAAEVSLTITPQITDNILNDNGEAFCDSGDPALIDGETPGGGDGDLSDDYQWQYDDGGGWTNIIGGTNEDYNPPIITTTTSYRRLVNSGNCTSTSNVVEIEIFTPVVVEADDDQTICSNGTATMAGSITGGITTGDWSTSGDGSFDDASQMDAVYTPGSGDIAAGSVLLTLTSDNPATPCPAESDNMTLNIVEDVAVDAGSNGEVCSTGTYSLSGASLSGDYSDIEWTTSGDGSFNNDGLVNPVYTPGATDISNGTVTLTIDITGVTPCGDKSDDMTLTVWEQPSVDAGTSPTICEGSTYTVNNANATDDYASLSWTTGGDGTFTAGQNSLTPTYNPGTNDISSGSVNLTLTATASGGTCVNPSDNMTITIEPAVDPGNIAASQSLCFTDDPVAFTSLAPASGGDGLSYQWYIEDTDPDNLFDALGGETAATFDEISKGVGTYYYFRRAVNSGVCPDANTDTLSIVVNPGPPAIPTNLTNNSPICEDGSVLVECDDMATATTYEWDVSWDGTSGDVDVVTTDPEANIDMSGVAPGSYTVRVRSLNGCGTFGWSGPTTVTVTQVPDASGSLNNAPTICNGEATDIDFISDISATGSWTITDTASTGAAGGSGLANGGNIGQTLNNNGTAPVGVVYTITPIGTAAPGCPGPEVPLTVIVNPSAQVNDPGDRVFCHNENTAIIAFTTNRTGGTTTYSWTNDNTAIGLGAGATGNIPSFTASNTGTSAITANIEVTPTFTNNGVSCDGTPVTFTITVNPAAQVNDPVDTVFCNAFTNGGIAFSTDNTGGTTTYTWSNNNTSIGLGAGATGNIPSFTATNTGTTPISGTITVAPTYVNNSKSCTGPSETFTITANPSGQVNAIANDVYCEGVSTLAIFPTTANTGDSTTYSWTNTETGIGLAASGSDSIPSFLATNTGTSQLSGNITVSPTYYNGGVGCPGSSEGFTLTINPAGQADNQSDVIYCNGEVTTQIDFTTSNSDGSTSYSWTNDNPLIGLPANGNNFVQSFTATNGGTEQDTALITVTPTYSNGGESCDGPEMTFMILVNPSGQVYDPIDTTYCVGESTKQVVFDTDNTDGTTTYAWTNSTTDIGLIASGSGNINSFVAANTTSDPISGNIQVTPTYSNGGKNCTGPAQNFTITVNPNGQINPVTDRYFCNNAASAAINFSTNNGTGSTTYAWTNDNTSIGLGGSGNGNIGSFTATNGGTSPISGGIEVTPTFTYNSKGCEGTATDFDIFVNPTGQVDQPSDTVYCEDESVALYTFTTQNSGGTTTYAWTNDETDIGLGSGSSGNLPAFTADNPTLAQLTGTIQVTPTFVNGSTSCAGTPVSYDITINPAPQVNVPSDLTYCNEDNVPQIDFGTNNTDGTTTYDWTNTNTAINLGAIGSGSIATFEASNGGTSPISGTIEVTPTYTNSGKACTDNEDSFTITVNPTAQVNDPTDQVICNGDNTADVNFSTNNSGGTTAYSWTNNNTSIGLAASGSGNIPSFQGQNLGTEPDTAVITVTPEFSNNSVACNGPSEEFIIVVNPTPNVTATAPNGPPYTILNGETTDITVDGDVAGTTFTWIVLNPGSTNASDGGPINQGDLIEQTLANNTAVPVTITYRIYSLANGCPGDSLDFDVVIDPSVDITVTNNAPNICSGQSSDIDVESLVTGATFTWTVTDLNGLGATPQAVGLGPNTGITISDQLDNTSNVTDSVIYHIMATGPSPTFATSAVQDVKVYVYPIPTATPVNNADSICDGTATDIEMDSDVAGTTFEWTVTDLSGTSGATASAAPVSIGYTIGQTLQNNSNTPITVTYNITPTGPAAGSCTGTTVPVNVVVNPTPWHTTNSTKDAFCSLDSTDITLNATVANSTFSWIVPAPNGTGANDGTGNMLDVIEQTLTNTTQSPVNVTYQISVNGPGTTACPGTDTLITVTVNPLPNTTPITGLDTVCEQTPGMIFSTDPETGSTFYWNLPGTLGTRNFGGTGFESNAIIFTAADIPGPGYVTDSVSVFEENLYGCTNDTLWKPLTLIPYPTPALISGDDEVCAQSTHTYSVPNNPGSTYQWFLPIGAGFETDPTLNEVTVTFGLISGNIRVTETTAGGCVTNHTNIYVTVRQLPVTTLNVDKPVICDGEEVIFTAGPTTDIDTFEFFINGTSVQNGTSNLYVSSTMAMDDTVTVNAISIYGCERLSPSVIMTVNPDPVVTLTSSAPFNTICDGASVTFEATSADAVLYNFFLNGVSQQAGPLYFWDTPSGLISDGDSVYVEVQNASGCWGASDTIYTTVNPLPVADIDGDYPICPGETRNIIVTVSTGTGPFDVTIDNGVPQQIGYISGNSIPVSPMSSTIYSITEITDDNGCTSTLGPNLSGAAEITVRDTAQILTQPKNIEVCEGVDTSFSVSAIGDALTYQWQVSDDLSSWTNLGNAAVQDIIAPDATDDGDYYRVVLTSTCNILVSDTVQLTIRYSPINARDPFNDTICEGSPTGFGVDAGATENPVFQWYLSTDDGSSWAPLQDTAAYTGSNSDSLRISTAASRFDGYQYYVDITGDCGGAASSLPATLFIYERPEIIEQPADTTVCENVPALFFVDAGVTSNPAFQWQVDMRDGLSYRDIGIDSVGVYAGYNNDTLRVLNPESRFDQYRYRVRVSGECTPVQTSSYATLTVNEEPEIVTQPVSKIICEDQSTIFTVNAGPTTGSTFTWEVDDGNGFLTIGADTAIYSGYASNTLFLSVVPSHYDGYQYRVTVGGICPGTVPSDIVDLTVNDVPEILFDPVNDTVCENDPAFFTVDFGETTNPTFRWQVNRIGTWQDIPLAEETVNYNGIEAATLNVLDPSLSYNNYRYRVRVSGTCTPAVISGEATLVVEKRPEVSLDPVDMDVCEDGDVFFTVQAGTTKEPGFFWEYSDDGGGSWDDAALLSSVTVSDDDTLVLTAVPSDYDGHLFRATITGDCPAVAPPVLSASALLTVYDKPEITIHPGNETACEQDTVLFIVDPGLTTMPAFVWQYYNGVSWLQVPPTIYEGVNNDTLQINGINSSINGTRYRVRVSGTCAPDSISEEAVLTVDERPEVVGIPLDQTICEGDDVSFGITAGVTTLPIIVWEYSDDNGLTWDDAVALAAYGGADTNVDTLTLSAVPATYNTYQFRAIVSNGCGPEDTSMVATLTVMNRPLIASEPADALTCEGIPTAFGIDPGITSDPIFTWEVDNGVSGWNPVMGAQYGGIGTDTLRVLNPNSSMNGYLYRVILGGYCSPNDTSAVVTLTVTENAEVTIQPLDASICETGDTLFYASPGVTTTPTFQWMVDPNTGTYGPVSNGGVYSGATDSILVITGAPFSMDGYQYKLEVTGDCGMPVESNPATLEVWKAPEITVQPSDTTTCELNNVKFTVNAGLTDFPTYQWYEDDGKSGMQPMTDGGKYIGTNSATLQIFGVDSAMTGYQYEVMISNTCGDITSDPKTLTVQSAPQIWTQPSDSTICEGGDAAFSVDATGTNLVFSWYVNDGTTTDSIVNGVVYSGQGTATLQITKADRSYDRNRYFVRIEGTCPPWVQSDIAFLNVGTPPEISIQPVNDTICEFSTAQFEVNATGDGLTYQWEERPVSGTFSPMSDGGYYIGTGQRTLSIFNVERTYDTYEYRVRIFGTCAPEALSDEVALTVKTAPVITSQPADTTVCHNSEALFGITAEGSDLQYTWRVDAGGGFVDIVPAYPNYGDYTGADSDTLVKLNALDSENGYRYQVRVSGYCSPSRTSNEAFMNVNSLPTVSDPIDKQVCEDGSTFFSATASGPDLQYQWMVSAGGTGPWTPVVDDITTYSGAKTDILTIDNAIPGMNGNLYRLDVSSSCAPVSSNPAELTVWENPTANITGDDADFIICGGDALELDGNPDGGSLVYTAHQWSGDVIPLGGVTNQQTATFMTNVKNNYTLNYTVTDDNGCKGTDTRVVENYRPVAGFTSDAVPACGNLTVKFTNTSSADAVSFNWDFDNGFSSTDTDPVQGFDNYDPSGLVAYYNVILTATDAQGCTDDAGGIVTIYPKVNPVITASPTSGCQPLSVLLETRSGAMDYVWEFGDGDFVTGVFSTYHNYHNLTTSQQTYQTVVTTTSAYLCVASDTVEITVDPIPEPKFTIVPNQDTIPVSGVQTVTLTNTTLEGPWTYTWDFGDGSPDYVTTSRAPITHDYTEAGTYRITLYAQTNDCLDSLPQTLTILPRKPVASFTSITEGCHPLEVTFTNTSMYADSYLWQFGDGSVSNSDSSLVTHTFYQPGDFTVKLLASGPGGNDQTSRVINVRPTPQVFFNYAPDSVFVNDKPVRFFNLTAYGEEYKWNFGDYDELTGEEDPDNTSTEADPLHVYMYEGWKDVLLVASNEYCEDSLFIPFAVKVIPAGEIRFPTVFRPGDSPTGGNTQNLNDPEAKNSVFFPGVNKQVTEYNLYIYTRWGQLVFESNDINIGWDGYIDGTKAAQGVYIWKVTGLYSNGSPFSLAGDVTLLWK
jgi:hypothetical protein